MTDSFVFYESYFEGMQELEEADRLALFTAICNYVFYGEVPKITGPAMGMFRIIIPTILAACNRKEMAKKAADRRWDKKPRPESAPTQSPEPNPKSPPSRQPQTPPPASTASEQTQPQEQYHHLGKMHNVCLSQEQYRLLKEQYPNYRRILDDFSIYKIKNRFTLLRDYEALQHYLVHKSLPKGVFERSLSEESLRLLQEAHAGISDPPNQS